MSTLQDKAIGAPAGAAVGDAMGGATEGRSAEEILERYDSYAEGVADYFLPDRRTAKPMSPHGIPYRTEHVAPQLVIRGSSAPLVPPAPGQPNISSNRQRTS